MIFKFKTKKDKEILRLNILAETLIECNKKNVKELNKYKDANCRWIEKEISYTDKICDLEDEIEKLKNKYEKTENLRRTVAGKAGGLMTKNHRLKEQLDIKEDYIKQQRDLIKKKEQDYLFALRVLFRETKMTTDTKAFLGQRLKELKEKYPIEYEWKIVNISHNTTTYRREEKDA